MGIEHRITVAERMAEVGGRLIFYERPARVGLGFGRTWRKVLEAENIVLNGFYNDLFNRMTGTVIDLGINALALGYGQSVSPARADTGLVAEWNNPLGTLTTGLTNGQTGIVALAVTAVPVPIPSGSQLQLAAGQTVTTSGATAAGATSIPVTSFTASQAYAIGTAVNATTTTWTPQRSGVTLTTPTTSDPPAMQWSFYFPAAANLVSLAFTEAGLLYKASSLSAGGTAFYATHAAFAYTKAVNTDLRIDYTLTRSLT